eukprot:CAMPEP_0194289246 /NCGR_PEP_ID=MMETSP0169-20130528/38641_1 /TAXON_ID=218684 /ORGANISM="Corethron pennatum, Strain L29A3" /LENGTH=246 /DNA_ID=CAMNT_0039036467 /DNA_START=289 /DNA_END=1029 /DNA_ORIENTATION=-
MSTILRTFLDEETDTGDEESTLPPKRHTTNENMKPSFDLFQCLPQCDEILGTCGDAQQKWEKEITVSYTRLTKRRANKKSFGSQQECFQQISDGVIKYSALAQNLLPSGLISTRRQDNADESYDQLSNDEHRDLRSETTSNAQSPHKSHESSRIVIYPKPVRRLRSEEMHNLFQYRPDLDVGVNQSLDEDTIDWDEVDDAAAGVGLDDDSIEIVTPEELESYILNDVNEISPQRRRWKMRPKKFLC